MARPRVVLMQAEDSPWREPVARALARLDLDPASAGGEAGPLPPDATLVLWDAHGLPAPERQARARRLAARGAEVFLLCPDLAAYREIAGGGVALLALLLPPVTPLALRASLEVALRLGARLAGLRAAREQAQRELEDRLWVERAKLWLVEQGGLAEREAMGRLQKLARRQRLSLAGLARRVLGDPAGPEARLLASPPEGRPPGR